jgi:hypothetical protein
MPGPPEYGIIYNWDGAPHGFSEVPQSMETFLEKVYAPLNGTQVGAHFWCVGQHAATWESDKLEVVGDAQGRRYEDASSYVATENLRRMLERGEDPQEGVVARGHELGLHVYASIRMNDNHLDGAQPEDLQHMNSTELTRLRVEHPEWLLGGQSSEWFASSWNFEHQAVREHRFAHIEEVCKLYDWDGVELDWQRHSFHLPEDHAYRLRYALTDLQRAVRRMTNELAARRGRPFYLAARVAPTPEMSRRIGFDVPTWISEGLVDILIPSGGYATDPSIEVESYVEMCAGAGVAVYPGLDVWYETIPGGEHSGAGHFVGPEEPVDKDRMRNRAVAGAYHAAGASGIYVFNWYADQDSKRELLTQIGSPDSLRGTDKIYAATHRYVRNEGPWRGALRNDRIHGEVPVALKRTLTGDGPTIKLAVADDLAADISKRIELRVRLRQWVKGDIVRLVWDGAEVTNVQTRYDIEKASTANPFAADIYDVGPAVWLSSVLSAGDVAMGEHSVKVVLVERHPQMVCDIVLTDVELVITY